ncbi:type II toxin-antitoxin system ParD family antitoxin [Nitrospirillum viridazoti]|uniref:Addiction module antidote protein n=1 Tax=Nitrospirillum viridazoti CBAmc TaxID=1441467 RepID=A0A248JM33_9PROT|nr:type II toxin-antitoxin system ParD family antitoxin [Nitrospirillum amazonense]ASG19782.1 addiction module antidote protein [Nitrospirillum amazonense CBAmc]TWB27294.1 antitoxin ParD1/3/4 [Nitrospirillum amazonense]
MPTRNVVLTDHHEQVIEDLVRSGRYQNASEVLRAGLRLIEREEAQHEAKLKALREAAEAGHRELDEGRFDEVMDGDLEEYIAVLGREAAGGH